MLWLHFLRKVSYLYQFIFNAIFYGFMINSNGTIHYLTDSVLIETFTYLDFFSLKAVAGVNHHWHALTESRQQFLWKLFCPPQSLPSIPFPELNVGPHNYRLMAVPKGEMQHVDYFNPTAMLHFRVSLMVKKTLSIVACRVVVDKGAIVSAPRINIAADSLESAEPFQYNEMMIVSRCISMALTDLEFGPSMHSYREARDFRKILEAKQILLFSNRIMGIISLYLTDGNPWSIEGMASG